MTAHAPPIPRFDPEPSEWAALIPPPPLTDVQRAFRSQLGLPTDRPVVLSGHQPTIWHPGILAKHLAATAFADSIDAHTAWLVVEHVEVNAHTIEYPIAPASPGRARLPLVPPPSEPTIASRSPAIRSNRDALPAPALLESAGQGASRILAALETHAQSSNLSVQITLAINELLAPIAPPMNPVYSSRMTATALFAELLGRIRQNPLAAAKSHNEALRAVPETGVTPLAIDEENPEATEIPLWVIRADGSRRKAIATDLATLPPDRFAPRVLFNTGIARLAGCDLFIHGVGGAAYDKATEVWFRAWLDRTLAPAVLVTADLYLPIAHDPSPPSAIARARWMFHNARHNPSRLGDTDSATRKIAMLADIRDARESGLNPAAQFRDMHALLEQYRAHHADKLESLREAIDSAEQAVAMELLAHDRSWAFPMYAHEQIVRLGETIRARFPMVCCSAAC